MKKLLSLILTLCMFGSFAISVSADTKYKHKIKVTETETGAVVEYIVPGSFKNLSGLTGILSIDSTKVTYNYDDAVFENFTGWSVDNIGHTDKYIVFNYGEANAKEDNYITDCDKKIATFYFTKVDGKTLEKGDIKIINTQKIGRTSYNIAINISGVKYTDIGIDNESFTQYVAPTPVAPTVTTPTEGIVGKLESNANTADNTKFDWTLPVTVPIGKTAYVTDGVTYMDDGITLKKFIVTDGKASATSPSGSTLTVSYTDAEDAVITYVVPDISKVYGTEPGIVAFGKYMNGTLGTTDEYGIIFGGEFDKAGKWTTTYNVGGIFAVEIADATTGTYTAKAFVNGAYGAELSITK